MSNKQHNGGAIIPQPKQRNKNATTTTGGILKYFYTGMPMQIPTDIFNQYAQFHAATSAVNCQIELLPYGKSLVTIGNIQHAMGFISREEWNLNLPPFVIALCAHWQAAANITPF